MEKPSAELLDELFADRELPRQAIVCGHIIAALQALPKTEEQVAARLEETLAQLEHA